MVLGFLLEWNYQSRQWVLSLDLWTIKLARLFALPSGLIVSWLGKRRLASSAVSSKCMKRKLTPIQDKYYYDIIIYYSYYYYYCYLLMDLVRKKVTTTRNRQLLFYQNWASRQGMICLFKMLLLRRRLGFFKTLVRIWNPMKIMKSHIFGPRFLILFHGCWNYSDKGGLSKEHEDDVC